MLKIRFLRSQIVEYPSTDMEMGDWNEVTGIFNVPAMGQIKIAGFFFLGFFFFGFFV